MLLTFATVVMFDIGCFFVLPEAFSSRIFLGYRVGLLPLEGLGRGYPRNYYDAHPERGFDIGLSKAPRDHFVFNYPRNYSYPIWSNSLGCFDSEHTDFTRYVYLAGDSTAWGYTLFDKKFGTLLEQRLNVPVVKCAVSHTGQLHQLSKMKEVVRNIGIPPAVILVVWAPNDIINDAFYPHSTIIDGWLVDTVSLTQAGDAVRDAQEVLAQRVQREMAIQDSVVAQPKYFLIKYSATYNILFRLVPRMRFVQRLFGTTHDTPDRMSIYALHRYPPTAPVLSYHGEPLAQRNREALLELRAYADSIHAKLLVALLSAQPKHNTEVIEFLREHSIKYVDVGDAGYNFNNSKLSWRIDPHANEEGNEVIANALVRFIEPELRTETGRTETPTN